MRASAVKESGGRGRNAGKWAIRGDQDPREVAAYAMPEAARYLRTP